MSILSAQRDRLRKVAGELQNIIDGLNKGHITYDGLMDTLNYSILCLNDASDTIWQLRNDCVDLRDENAKLRELVLILLTCASASDLDDCGKCPINGGTGVWGFEDFCDGLLDRVHELEIEVRS